MGDEFVKKKWYTIPLSCIGMVGITAFLCLQEVGRPRPGDVCVVTDAAGPFGSLAVQVLNVLYALTALVWYQYKLTNFI